MQPLDTAILVVSLDFTGWTGTAVQAPASSQALTTWLIFVSGLGEGKVVPAERPLGALRATYAVFWTNLQLLSTHQSYIFPEGRRRVPW